MYHVLFFSSENPEQVLSTLKCHQLRKLGWRPVPYAPHSQQSVGGNRAAANLVSEWSMIITSSLEIKFIHQSTFKISFTSYSWEIVFKVCKKEDIFVCQKTSHIYALTFIHDIFLFFRLVVCSVATILSQRTKTHSSHKEKG